MTYLCISATDHSRQNLWVHANNRKEKVWSEQTRSRTWRTSHILAGVMVDSYQKKWINVHMWRFWHQVDVDFAGLSTSETASCLFTSPGWRGRAASSTGGWKLHSSGFLFFFYILCFYEKGFIIGHPPVLFSFSATSQSPNTKRC